MSLKVATGRFDFSAISIAVAEKLRVGRIDDSKGLSIGIADLIRHGLGTSTPDNARSNLTFS